MWFVRLPHLFVASPRPDSLIPPFPSGEKESGNCGQRFVAKGDESVWPARLTFLNLNIMASIVPGPSRPAFLPGDGAMFWADRNIHV